MDRTHHASATELAAAIRSRRISSRELLQLYLTRIAQHDPALNAVVTLDAERALARAAALDDRLARGELAGPLHGLPVTIKDALETAGIRTTGGAREHAAYVPARDALAVQRLLAAGAVVFGKTNVPAYSADMQTYNELFGVTRNPHALDRTPGGSSGGAAAAVAAGLTAFELGSDIGGSIRTPAHFTGVFGHKPSHGLVPARGHIPPAPGALSEPDLGVVGPLARSADDLALLLSVVAGPEPEQAKALRLALPPPRRTTLRDYRLAVWLDDAAVPVDAEPLRVLTEAVGALRAAGATVDERARPDLSLAEVIEDYRQLLDPILVADMPQSALDRLQARAQQQPAPGTPDFDAVRFARSAMAPHVHWLHAHERRMQLRARMAQFFDRYDALLCPVNPVLAIPHDHAGTQATRTIQVNGAPRPYLDLLGWIALATSAHLPATVVPVGRSAGGLPVGLQIVGPHLEDATTIDIAGRIAAELGGFAPPAGY